MDEEEKNRRTEELLVKGIQLDQKMSDFRKHLTELRNEAPQAAVPEPRKNVRPLWQWGSALAAALVLALGYALYFAKPDQNKLYEQYYEPYSAAVMAGVTRGGSEESVEQKAVSTYENGDYSAAIPLLQKLSASPDGAEWQLYLGIAYLETGDLGNAEKALLIPAERPGGLFYKQSNWYLALLYLKKGQIKDAELILNKLKAGTNAYAQKSEALLKDLK